MALKKQLFRDDETPIFDDAIIYKRGDQWQFRMWLEKEHKYVRKSLRTKNKATALDRAKSYYLEIHSNVQQGKTYFSISTKEGVELYIKYREKDLTAGLIVERRPLVAKLIIDQNLTTGDDEITDNLLLALHSPTMLTDSLLKPYLMANQHIKRHPQLIWLMLLRAEAWFMTRTKRRGNWGGNRKLVISADTDSKIPVKSKYDELFEGMEERPINIF